MGRFFWTGLLGLNVENPMAKRTNSLGQLSVAVVLQRTNPFVMACIIEAVLRQEAPEVIRLIHTKRFELRYPASS